MKQVFVFNEFVFVVYIELILSQGDVNGDGYKDIIVASAFQTDGVTEISTTYIIFGSGELPSEIFAESMVATQVIVLTGGGQIVSGAGNLYCLTCGCFDAYFYVSIR